MKRLAMGTVDTLECLYSTSGQARGLISAEGRALHFIDVFMIRAIWME
jgi:hypothetical protein